MKQIARSPYFLFLLPFFFFLHGLLENYTPLLIKTALLQSLFFTGIGFILALLLYPLFKDIRKTALAAFSLLAINFFFGSVQDLLRSYRPNAFFVKYSFLVSFILALIVLLFIFIKKAKHHFIRVTLFLNALFLILILIDLSLLLRHVGKTKSEISASTTMKFSSCGSCGRPDIYFIIADEYAGRQELEEIFGFDNSAFEMELEHRGFHVIPHSTSNYNATIYSIASMLNMDWLPYANGAMVTEKEMVQCKSLINDNNTTRFFKDKGYRFYDHSFFVLAGKPAAIENYYFVPKRKIFTAQTFTSRAEKELGYHLFSRKKIKEIEDYSLNNDRKVDSLTRLTVAERSASPKFVYAHFTMPHYPYYFDRNGQPLNAGSLSGFELLKKQYTEYLLYTNQKLLYLVDHIQKNSAQPPVIVLAGDHGFRQFATGADRKYYFMNLGAVYLPNGNYQGFYEGLSTVNFFRVILNAQFGQLLPLAKDSTVFLTEPASAF